MILWLKAFHIVFVVTYFAGLFYLPRLFVYHASATDTVSLERFVVMERRLYGITHMGGALAVLFGIGMVVMQPAYLHVGWLQVKLPLVVLLLVYQTWCKRLLVAFREGRNTHTQRWYRWFNEAPALLLIAIAILAVVKPF